MTAEARDCACGGTVMRRLIAIIVLTAIAVPTTGCVMAVRKVAREANRSGVQDKARDRFPKGSSIAAARTSLTADGYRCLDLPALDKTPAHTSCWPKKRISAPEKFLVGGNWRWDLYGDGDMLTKVHIASARHGMKKYREAAKMKASAAPVPM